MALYTRLKKTIFLDTLQVYNMNEKLTKLVADKKIIIPVIALLIIGAGIFVYVSNHAVSAEYIDLQLKSASEKFFQDSVIDLSWNTNVTDKQVLLSINPEEGKTAISEAVDNSGTYSITAFKIGTGGKYEIVISNLEGTVIDRLSIETFYATETIYGVESVDLGGGYRADRNGVFYRSPDQRLNLGNSGVFFENPWMFRPIDEGVAFQDSKYFIHEKEFKPQTLGLSSNGDLKILLDYISILFSYDGKVVWADEDMKSFKMLGSADTFRFISSGDKEIFEYFVIDGKVYFNDSFSIEEIKGADAKTFQFAGDCGYAEIYHSFYMKDQTRVYAGAAVISNDAKNFVIYPVDSYPGEREIPGGAGYAKDLGKVYYGCRELTGADAASFQYLGKGEAKDKNHIYRFGGIVNLEAEAENENIASWKNYSDSQLGLSFKYPPSWGEPSKSILSTRTEIRFKNGAVISSGGYYNQDLGRLMTVQEIISALGKSVSFNSGTNGVIDGKNIRTISYTDGLGLNVTEVYIAVDEKGKIVSIYLPASTEIYLRQLLASLKIQN